MRPAQVNSFLRFTIGFLVFISVSFCVTIAANTMSRVKDADQAAAAARAMMLDEVEE
jgi:hypothetical protein